MFQSARRVQRRTGGEDQSRFEFLQTLVREYGESVDRQEPDVANERLARLGNFAYDPLNHDYLRQLNVLDLFLDALAGGDALARELAAGGLCNLSADGRVAHALAAGDGLAIVQRSLQDESLATIEGALATLWFVRRRGAWPSGPSGALRAYLAQVGEDEDPQAGAGGGARASGVRVLAKTVSADLAQI
nr:Armadillo repeat-containing protein 7 [Polyrhizophydium stewartii]